MSGQLVLWERIDAIGYLTLNRPEKLNALNPQMLAEFDAALEEARRDRDAKIIVIRGNGRSFSAGYDLTGEAGVDDPEHDVIADRESVDEKLDRWLRVWDFPKPVIAQIQGHCLAGATQLAIACDVTVVADDAQIGLPSIPLGAGVIAVMWTFLVGPKRAKELGFSFGKRIDGRTAAEWGFANRSVPRDALAATVHEMASQMAIVPSSTLKLQKMAINRAVELSGFRHAIHYGADTNVVAHFSHDLQRAREALRTGGTSEAIHSYQSGDLAR